MKEYKTLLFERQDQVATIKVKSAPYGSSDPAHLPAWELGSLFSELREDNSIRVIILTGYDDNFNIPVPKETYHANLESDPDRHKDPSRSWHLATGVLRLHQTMAEIEKVIIAKINGDAIGFGQSLMFASDLIVAREDAIILDHHMAGTFTGNYNGEQKVGGHDIAYVPGDGGAALVPLFMNPCKAKEYLMLAQHYTAAELARLGIINYAVPAAELDAKVEELVQQLLKREAYALARTKRLVNRRVIDQLNLTLDAAVAYQMVCQMQPHHIHKLG